MKGEGEKASFGLDALTSLNSIAVLGLAGAGKHGNWHVKWLRLACKSRLSSTGSLKPPISNRQ